MWARRNPRFRGHWGRDAPRYFFGEEHWQQPLRWQRKCERLERRKRVLVSLCDPFEMAIVGSWDVGVARARLFRLIEQTPLLDWLLLTKRPANISKVAPSSWLDGTWPSNLWLGVSVWDQRSADRSIPLLLEVPAAVRWVSAEPLLGPLDARELLGEFYRHDRPDWPRIDWLVVGCESRGSRPGQPLDLAWAERLSRQCKAAGVPMFTKQLAGGAIPRAQRNLGRRQAREQLLKSAELADLGWPVQMPAKGGDDGRQ
jgi:protein gp37